MGPLFVLLFWVIAGSILSAVGSVTLALFVRFLLRGVRTGRKRATMIAAALPVTVFAYLFVCVLLFSLWSIARDRDMGWGDTWDTPILSTYRLMVIDGTDEGTIYNRADPGVYSNGSVAGSPGQRDVVFDVLRMEVRPPYLLGAASTDESSTDESLPHSSRESLFFCPRYAAGDADG